MGGKDRVPVETVCGAAAFSQKAAKAGFVSAGMFLTGKRVDLRCHALRCTPCGGVAVLRVSRAGDFCRDEAGKRKGGCATGCRKRASARLFGRAEEGRAVGAAKVQAECRRGAASFARRKEPNALTLPKLYMRTENAVPRRPSAERGRVLEGSGFGMVSRRR